MDITRNIDEIKAFKYMAEKARERKDDWAQWAAAYIGLVELLAGVLVEVLEEQEEFRKVQGDMLGELKKMNGGK
jgi:hypothetical protein